MTAALQPGWRVAADQTGATIILTADEYSFVDRDGQTVHGGGYQPVGDDGDPVFGFRDQDFGEAINSARVCNVIGITFRPQEVQSDAFSPGRRLRLVPDPANAYDRHAIEVRTLDGTLMAGFIPRAIAAEITPCFGGDGPWEAMALWEWRSAMRGRIGIRVLMAPRLEVGVATAIIRSDA